MTKDPIEEAAATAAIECHKLSKHYAKFSDCIEKHMLSLAQQVEAETIEKCAEMARSKKLPDDKLNNDEVEPVISYNDACEYVAQAILKLKN